VPVPAELTCPDEAPPVRFTPPDPVGRLLAAVDSIWILRGDSTVDEERSQSERGKWLTRTLQGPWEDQTDLG
jgi:hypothetical protein